VNSRKQSIKTSTQKPIPESKKWQKLFRYVAERETACKELVIFVHLVHDLSKHCTVSPESIRDKNGDKIYL
jgi:hypothetical protein